MSQTCQTLIQAIEQADTPDRLVKAVQDLAAQKQESAIPTLITVLGYNNPGAALAAVAGLVELGEVAVQPLLEQLDGYNYGARAYAIRALAAIADPRALSVLVQAAVEDFAPSVRRAAAKGLGRLNWQKLPPAEQAIGQQQAKTALQQVVQDVDWAIRYAGVVGLQGLAQQPECNQEITHQLHQLRASETEPAVRSRLQLAIQQLAASFSA